MDSQSHTSLIPPWAEVDPRELYESLFNFPLHEAEIVIEDGKPVHSTNYELTRTTQKDN